MYIVLEQTRSGEGCRGRSPTSSNSQECKPLVEKKEIRALKGHRGNNYKFILKRYAFTADPPRREILFSFVQRSRGFASLHHWLIAFAPVGCSEI